MGRLLVVLHLLLATGCGEDPDVTLNPPPGQELDFVDWAYDVTTDGSRVIYRHLPSRDHTGGVYMLETDELEPILLFPDSLPYFVTDCRFSSDGSKIAYTRDFLSDIYVHDLVDGTDTRVTFTSGNARSPDWHPSARYLVYTRVFRNPEDPDSSAGLRIVDLQTLSDSPFTVEERVVFGDNARWSPNGEMLAYSAWVRLSPSIAPPHIWAAASDGSSALDLTPGDSRSNEYPDWLDNFSILFESYGASTHLQHVTQSVQADGGNRMTLSVDVRPYIAYSAVARTVGKYVYSGPDSTGRYGVLLLRSLSDGDGSTIQQLTTYVPPDSMGGDGAARQGRELLLSRNLPRQRQPFAVLRSAGQD
jgi:hypothetical protein